MIRTNKEGDELDFEVIQGKDNVMSIDIKLEDGTILRVMTSVVKVIYTGINPVNAQPIYQIQSSLAILPLKFNQQLKLEKE